jgi:C4-type Zn-finger protein
MLKSTSILQQRVEARVQAELDAQTITCPACGYEFDAEDMENHITYHGEEGSQEQECPNCQAELVIEEEVVRTFTVILKPAAEAAGGES